MALDKTLTQNIELTASGDELARTLDVFTRKIDSVVQKLVRMDTAMMNGGKKAEQQYRSAAQQLQRLIGEASTLNNLMNGASNKRRDSLLSVLDEQSLGRKGLSASRLKQELQATTKASEALDLRLFSIEKRIANLTQSGRAASKTDINRALNTKEAIREVERLERELARLDVRAKMRGGKLTPDAKQLRERIDSGMGDLLSIAQNPKLFPKNGWVELIEPVRQLTRQYGQLAAAQERAALAGRDASTQIRRSILENINQNEAMLRATVERGASRYRFTPEQARNSDMLRTGREIDQNIAKLRSLQIMMSKALDPQTARGEATLRRLQRYWDQINTRTSEAIALQKAYNNLPEQKGKAITQALFGDGGLALGTRIGGAMVIAAGFSAVFGAVQSGVQSVLQLEDALARLQAIAGATDGQMRVMAQGIIEVARSSRYSIVEVTEAATQIAQAGFSARETTQVLKDALTLATGSGSTPQEAVETLTSALGAFQLQASESTRVVDTLMQGLNRSKLSIAQMQQAIQYAGATAKETGISFEELVALSASLANAGIRSGSTIGTGLRQLIVDLQTPSKDFQTELQSLGLTMADVDVKALGLAQVVKNLTDAGFSAEAAYASFEVRAASAFLAFRNQIDVYDDLALAIAQAGAAAEAQARAMDSLSANWQRLKNELVTFIATAAEPLVSAIKVIVSALGALVGGLNSISPVLTSIAGGLATVAAAFAINPILGWVTAVSMAIGVVKDLSDNMDELRTKTAEAQEKFTESTQTVSSVDEAIQRLISRNDVLTKNQVALQAEVVTLSNRFKGLAGELSGVALSYDEVLKAMLRYRGEALRQAALNADATLIASGNEKQGLVGQLRQNTNAALMPFVANSTRTPQALDAIRYIQANAGRDYSKSSSADLLVAQNNTQDQINRLSRLKNLNGGDQRILSYLQERLDLLRQIAGAQGRIDIAQRDVGIYNERSSKEGQARDAAVLEIERGITTGLRDNDQTPGSGSRTITATLAQAEVRIQNLKRQLAGLPESSAKAMVISSSIAELEAQVARVNRAERTANDRHGEAGAKDRPGARLDVEQVANEIRRRVPRARITETTRSVAQQRRYGTRRGDPAKAPHVTGNALDMGIIAGMDPLEIVAILENMGLEVTAAPVQAPGIRYVTPNHGTGPHWHFEWKPKTTKYERAQDTAAAQAARELQQLLEQEAGYGTSKSQAAMSRLINEAKAGSRGIGDMTAEFETLSGDYRSARLNEFDVKNPVEGLSPTMLKARTGARATLEAEITERVAGFHAQFWRAISDAAGKDLDAALSAGQLAFDRNVYSIEERVRAIETRGQSLGNNLNRNRYGAGAAYRQQRDEFNARLDADRATVDQLGGKALGQSLALGAYERSIKGMDPKSEEYTTALQKRNDVEQKLNETLKEREALQASINSRTQEGVSGMGTLTQRLHDAVAGWAENSGVMTDWGTTLENNVAPALDLFSNQLAAMFENLVTGARSFRQALGDMMKAFAQFVVQIIMKALALMAIKAILGAFGLQLESSPGGVIIGKKPKASYDGGPVEGRYNGGAINHLYGGGDVRQGFSTHDSALYDLAQGEYVVRNKSVRELGLPFMDAINKHGRAGLNKMAGRAANVFQMPRQETNVFVVQEKQAPPMGPNDVLVTVQNDILQNGPTKRLIRSVAQGG